MAAQSPKPSSGRLPSGTEPTSRNSPFALVRGGARWPGSLPGLEPNPVRIRPERTQDLAGAALAATHDHDQHVFGAGLVPHLPGLVLRAHDRLSRLLCEHLERAVSIAADRPHPPAPLVYAQHTPAVAMWCDLLLANLETIVPSVVT